MAECQAAVPLRDLARKAKSAEPPRDFAGALRQDGIRLIAEIKRASPSKGVFAPDLDPAALAQTYAANGASALSVLTDQRFFQGSLADLASARAATSLPALRKDFTTDEYHVVKPVPRALTLYFSSWLRFSPRACRRCCAALRSGAWQLS